MFYFLHLHCALFFFILFMKKNSFHPSKLLSPFFDFLCNLTCLLWAGLTEFSYCWIQLRYCVLNYFAFSASFKQFKINGYICYLIKLRIVMQCFNKTAFLIRLRGTWRLEHWLVRSMWTRWKWMKKAWLKFLWTIMSLQLWLGLVPLSENQGQLRVDLAKAWG